MTGSVAEERIRAKVEAGFRAAYPDARVIHELVVGSCRADVAAVTPDAIVLAEIKSERDTLLRLSRQTKEFAAVTKDVRIYAATKHGPALTRMASSLVQADGRLVVNPEFVEELWDCSIWVERSTHGPGFEFAAGVRPVRESRRVDAAAVFQLLWADEMRQALRGVAQGLSHSPIRDMVTLALEHLTGRQIRQATCAALRRRSFPRADAPMGAT